MKSCQDTPTPPSLDGSLLFHLPKTVFDACFQERDLQRLPPGLRLHRPTSDDSPSLLAEWDRRKHEIEIVVTGWGSPPISNEMLHCTPLLKLIIHSAGSVRHYIPDLVWSSGVKVASANDALGQSVAETTLGLIIAGLKGFFPSAGLTRSGGWKDAIPPYGYGRVRELYDVKIGVIGASRTGRHLLRLLSAFETNVLLYDPTLTREEAADLNVRSVSLQELLRESDVVTLHAPALPSLHHLLGAGEFALMKDDALFINTARGMLVDEAALTKELKKGRISAMIDVTNPEPPAPQHPFRLLPNVVLLPHISGALTTGRFRLGRSTVNQIHEYLHKKRLSGEITVERFVAMA